MIFTLLTVRSKSEDDALDAYTPSRRDTGSRRDTISKKNESMLRRDISNASQLSAGLSFCFLHSVKCHFIVSSYILESCSLISVTSSFSTFLINMLLRNEQDKSDKHEYS